MSLMMVLETLLRWAGFIGVIILLLLLDLKLFSRDGSPSSIKKAVGMALMWILFALLFNLFIFSSMGLHSGIEFLTASILEYSLSLDNLFVMLLIFQSFRVPKEYQHKVLFWGIIGVIIMRGFFIIIGSALIRQFEWLFYVFGTVLLYSGIRTLRDDKESFNPQDNLIVRLVRKLFPVSNDSRGGRFFLFERGRLVFSTLFVTLLVIEFTDLVFAFDSIPAIFGVTTDPFIIFTSNIFAVLGLRSLYFILARLGEIFKYLNKGLSLILIFIGIKMILSEFINVPTEVSLSVLLAIIVFSISLSLIMSPGPGLLPLQKKAPKASRLNSRK